MSRKQYSEKLKDPRWQKKRLQVFENAEWRCQICGSKTNTLNVHHSYYLPKKEPWQYPLGSLIASCESCHDVIHKTVKQKRNNDGEWRLMWFPFNAPQTNEQAADRHRDEVIEMVSKQEVVPDKFKALREMLLRK